MKKLVSIFFLSIFLFNWFGYRLVSTFLANKANSVLISSLDKDQYNDSELVTIKLPSNLPYYSNSKHFDRIDGEIEMNGIHYNFVKCRMYKDSIEYLCIPNQARTKLSNARDEFYKLVNDLQHPSQNKKADSGNSVKSLLSEFYQETDSWTFSAYFSVSSITSSFYHIGISQHPSLPRELPPDAC